MDANAYMKLRATTLAALAHQREATGEDFFTALVGSAATLVWIADEAGLTRDQIIDAIDREAVRLDEMRTAFQKPKARTERKLKLAMPPGWNKPDGCEGGE